MLAERIGLNSPLSPPQPHESNRSNLREQQERREVQHKHTQIGETGYTYCIVLSSYVRVIVVFVVRIE